MILVDGVPAGRLYVHRRPAEIRLVDITFLPELRGGGQAGDDSRRGLQPGDAALRERLGFQPAEERGPYRLMKWTPAGLS
jgi:hypothetical protein